MTNRNCKIEIPADDLDRLNGILAGTIEHGVKYAEVIWQTTAKFDDGYEADVKLVSCGRSGADNADTPYIDAVLFDMHGAECYVAEPTFERIEGEYPFEDCGHAYTVEIVRKGA